MKTYFNQESDSGSSETFADLTFCALVVLVLFVLTLTVEVSQRVRAENVVVEELAVEDVETMTPEEIAELSQKLAQQSEELRTLRSKTANAMASMTGEQRFTGAREPATVYISHNYVTRRYMFCPAEIINDADRQRSGESFFESQTRMLRTLKSLAYKLALDEPSRYYTASEVNAILGAIPIYQKVDGSSAHYYLSPEHIGVVYHPVLCKFLSGDNGDAKKNELVELGISKLDRTHPPGDKLYPHVKATVDETARTVTIGGVTMKAKDLRDFLFSISGRGIVLDLEGYEGKVPNWLYDGALMPTGYCSKTPKLPQR